MNKTDELEVTVFEWPDRFFVEPDGVDVDYQRFFPDLPDYYPLAPYLVDLGEYEDGWCGCRDFAVNVQPHLSGNYDKSTPHRTVCKHILAARHFLLRHNFQKPKQLTTELEFQ